MVLSLTKDGRETGSKSINLLSLSHSHPFLKDKIYVTGRKAREGDLVLFIIAGRL